MLGRRRNAAFGVDELAMFLDQVALVLGTGISPRHAWLAVGEHAPHPESRDLAEYFANTPAQLMGLTHFDTPHPAPFAATVMCVRACETTGAPLAALLGTLAQGLRDEADASRARAAAFAGSKTTAYVLMALPLLSIALGYAVGANPLGMLFGSPLGLAMLFIGASLMVYGWIWMGRLVAKAHAKISGIDPLIVIDTLGHILHAGLPLAVACERLGEGLGQTHPAEGFTRAGAGLLRGMAPSAAFLDLPDAYNVLPVAAEISQATGAQLVPLLSSATREQRRTRVRDVERKAAELAVKLVIPTGVTILPAFVILGIVPIIADLLTTHFHWMT